MCLLAELNSDKQKCYFKENKSYRSIQDIRMNIDVGMPGWHMEAIAGYMYNAWDSIVTYLWNGGTDLHVILLEIMMCCGMGLLQRDQKCSVKFR